MRRVTFSRNYTLSLSRTCRCVCKYCAFATRKAHLYSPDEVEDRLEQALRRNAKELLVLTGEQPEVNAEVAERLRASSRTSSGRASGRSSAASCRTRTWVPSRTTIWPGCAR